MSEMIDMSEGAMRRILNDRIEDLEAKLARYNDLVADKIDLQSENIALKAKLAKAVMALQTIKMRAMTHKDDDDKDRKRQLIHIHSTSNTTLAELTGGKDE